MQDVGIDLGRIRPSARGCPRRRRSTPGQRIGPHDQRLAAASDHRQRQPGAGSRELSHQRQWIDLGLRSAKSPTRSLPGASGTGNGRAAIASAAACALGRRHCIAPRERGVAQLGFLIDQVLQVTESPSVGLRGHHTFPRQRGWPGQARPWNSNIHRNKECGAAMAVGA